MNEVTVQKTELLSVILKNKEEHLKEYKAMMIEFKKSLLLNLQDLIEINSTREKGFLKRITESEPENHEEDYNKIISMLQMSINDEIVLDNREYDKYVLNNWSWKESFEFSKTSYYKG